MTEYPEGQAPPNFSEAVNHVQRSKTVTKIGQNPNIRPMVHNNIPIQNNAVNSNQNNNNKGNIMSQNNDNIVFYGQSVRKQSKSGGVVMQNNNKTMIINNNNNNNMSDPNDQIGIALQVQSTQPQSAHLHRSTDECFTSPWQIAGLSLLGIGSFIAAFMVFGNNAYMGWLLLFIGFISWICVGIGLSKLHNENDDTPAWVIVCCPCICLICFICGAAGDGASLNMFEPKRKYQQRQQHGVPPKGNVIVST